MPEANIFENKLVDSYNSRINKIKLKYKEINKNTLDEYLKVKEKSKLSYEQIKKSLDNDFDEKIKYLENMKKMAEEVVPVTIQTYENLKRKINESFDNDMSSIEDDSESYIKDNNEKFKNSKR